MADEPETNDELLLTDEVDEQEPEQGETDNSDEGDEETVLSFGDEEAPAATEPADGSGLVKHLREEVRKRDKLLAEARRSAPQPQAIEVGEKPTLADCEYDEEKFESELDAWKQRKDAAERSQNEAAEARRKLAEREQETLRAYDAKKATVPGIADAEEEVAADLGESHFNALRYASEDPALIKALHLFPAKRAALMEHKDDPLKWAFEAGKLAGSLKVTRRSRAPDPEQIERGSGAAPASADKQLERLQKEADKTGDRTKLIAYKRQGGRK
jgi:hypothetical protein